MGRNTNPFTCKIAPLQKPNEEYAMRHMGVRGTILFFKEQSPGLSLVTYLLHLPGDQKLLGVLAVYLTSPHYLGVDVLPSELLLKPETTLST